MNSYKDRQNQLGLTIIEVLIAALITSLLGIAVFKVLTNASIGLSRNSGEINANLEIMNLTRKLRYDFSGSYNVYVQTNEQPCAPSADCSAASTNKLYNYSNVCSSVAWPQSTVSTRWEDKNSINFLRPLFSVKVKDLKYDKSARNIGWINPSSVWFGYEIRRINSIYSIWRVSCSGDAKPEFIPKSDAKMLTLGGQLSSVQPSGKESLNCAIGILDLSRSNNQVTLNTKFSHNFVVGQSVYIDIQPQLIDLPNGRYSITGTPSNSSFTFNAIGNNFNKGLLTLEQQTKSTAISNCPINSDTSFYNYYQFRVPYITNVVRGNPYIVVKEFSSGNTQNDINGVSKILIGTLVRRLEVIQ